MFLVGDIRFSRAFGPDIALIGFGNIGDKASGREDRGVGHGFGLRGLARKNKGGGRPLMYKLVGISCTHATHVSTVDCSVEMTA